MRKSIFARGLMAAVVTLMAATANAAVTPSHDFSLHGNQSASRHEVYAIGGILGGGIGYAYGVNKHLTVRGDITTMGSISKDFSAGKLDYKAKVKNNVGTLYGDFFPFDSGFRLTAGVGVRDTRAKGHAQATGEGTVRIGNTRITFDEQDRVDAEVKMPSVTPYLGFGYGHNVGQHVKPGWGFIADVGVYFGKPKVSFDVNQATIDKLNRVTQGNAQREIDEQKRELKDKVDKLKVIPALYVGISYRF